MHLGKLHVLIIHFPIALGIAAGMADLLWLVLRRDAFRAASLYCLVGALAVTPFAVATGEILRSSIDASGSWADLAEDHEHMGIASLCAMVGAAVVRGFWAKRAVAWLPWLYGLLVLAMVVCVAITGEFGGKLVYGEDFWSNVFQRLW